MKDIKRKKKKKRVVPRSGLKSEKTRSAFAAAEWKAVLAFETKDKGASILLSYAWDAYVTKIKNKNLCQGYGNLISKHVFVQKILRILSYHKESLYLCLSVFPSVCAFWKK